jgi:hypothetical protein
LATEQVEPGETAKADPQPEPPDPAELADPGASHLAPGPGKAPVAGSPTAGPVTPEPPPRRGTPRQIPGTGTQEGTQRPAPGDAGQAEPGKAGPDREAKKPAAKPVELDPAERRLRLAAITSLAFQLKSADRNPKSKLNMLIRQEAVGAAEQVGLKTSMEDTSVMYLTLETSEMEGGLLGFKMSAELKQKPDPDADEVTIWEHEDVVATVSPHTLRRPVLPAPLKSGVSDFFHQFTRAYRQAKAERDKNRAPNPGS